jgi:hypothetical protein
MTISGEVRVYLRHKPYVLEALHGGILNSSALARLVQRELGLKSNAYNAVKAAVRRYSDELKTQEGAIERNALEVLKENSVTLADKTAVVVSSAKLEMKSDAEVKIGQYYIYLTGQSQAKRVPKGERAGLVKVETGCSTITIHSGVRVENTTGVIAFLSSVLAEQGINLVELISCYTETMIVVKKADALRGYQIISEIVG